VVINVFNFFGHYKSLPFHAVIRIHLVIISYFSYFAISFLFYGANVNANVNDCLLYISLDHTACSSIFHQSSIFSHRASQFLIRPLNIHAWYRPSPSFTGHSTAGTHPTILSGYLLR